MVVVVVVDEVVLDYTWHGSDHDHDYVYMYVYDLWVDSRCTVWQVDFRWPDLA